MIKACLILALTFCASAQDVQGLLNQINNAAAPIANDVNLNRIGDALSLVIGEYEWVLSENGEGEVGLNVNNVPGNSNNVASTLAGLLATAGASAQDNSDVINNIVSNEAESVGIVIQDNNVISEAAEQYGNQIQDNAESVSPALADVYNQVASQISTNQNGIKDQVNQQLNSVIANPNAGVNNIGDVLNLAYNNLPANTVNNVNDIASNVGNEAANVALGLAANVDPAQSTAVLENIPSSVDLSQITNTVNNAAGSASSVTSNAVSSLPSNVVVSVPNLRGGL